MATVYMIIAIFGAVLQVNHGALINPDPTSNANKQAQAYENYSPARGLSLIFTALNTDSCQQLKPAIEQMKTATADASALIGEIAADVSSTWVASWDCISFNVFKSLPCFINNLKQYKEAFDKYKPQIVVVNDKITTQVNYVFKTLQQCLTHLM